MAIERSKRREQPASSWAGNAANSDCLVSKHLRFVLAVASCLLDSRSVFRPNETEAKRSWRGDEPTTFRSPDRSPRLVRFPTLAPFPKNPSILSMKSPFWRKNNRRWSCLGSVLDLCECVCIYVCVWMDQEYTTTRRCGIYFTMH